MNMKCIIALTAAVLITGCAASPQPFDYHDDRDEKSGPGLFSGEEGGFVINGGPSHEAQDAESASEKKDNPAKEPAQ